MNRVTGAYLWLTFNIVISAVGLGLVIAMLNWGALFIVAGVAIFWGFWVKEVREIILSNYERLPSRIEQCEREITALDKEIKALATQEVD